MPISVRPLGKASMIASQITGTPEPGRKRKKKKNKVEAKVLFEETRRV